MNRHLEITTEEFHPLAILRLGGFFARLEVYRLKKQIDTLLAEGKRFVILDLTQTGFIDSAGIGVICQIRADCLKAGGKVVIVTPAVSQVRRMLETPLVNQVIEFFDQVETAVEFIFERYGLGRVDLAMLKKAGDGDGVERHVKEQDKLEERLDRLEQRFDTFEKTVFKHLTRPGSEVITD